MANLLRSPLLNQIRAVPGIPQRVTLSETWYKSALEMWNELQPILHYSGWHIRASSDQNRMFRKGVTILSGIDAGTPIVCAIRLQQLINSADMHVPVLIMKNQASKDLEECNNECIEILFGDFN
jgi:hypothetical protein